MRYAAGGLALGLLIGALGTYCAGPSSAEVREARVQARAAQDSLAKVEAHARVLRDSLHSERVREREVRIVYRERRIEAERETVEAGESLQQSIARLRDAQPALADSLHVQVGRLEDGYRAQIAAADSTIGSLERDLTLAEAEALTYRNEASALRMARSFDRALIDQLERERKLSLPFGLQVPRWVGYVGAFAAGMAVAEKL